MFEKKVEDMCGEEAMNNESWTLVVSNHRQEDTTTIDRQDKWVKNLSNRDRAHPEKKVVAKRLKLAFSPQQLAIVDLITATESAININFY